MLLSLAAALAVGTVLESLYDTPTAQYSVYRALWFRGILALLGVNIFAVAMSRYPWKRKHIPFLLAHLGILILLGGAWITDRFGLDGSMRISEGEAQSAVEIDQGLLVLSESDRVQTIPLQWLPPGAKFSPISTTSYSLPYDLTVDQFISHAEPVYTFLPNKGDSREKSAPALRLKIAGGPMRISQEIWLWAGAKSWSQLQAGPAWLSLGNAEDGTPPGAGPKLFLNPEKDGSLSYRAVASGGRLVRGKLPSSKISGHILDPNWKGVTITFSEWIPDARVNTSYRPSRVQYGERAPWPAIHLVAKQGGEGSEVWLGMGERAVLYLEGKEVGIGYFRKRVFLPFSIRLDRFTIEHDQGTRNPAAYSSKVSVLTASPVGEPPVREQVISMNEPLVHGGITFYQASYEEAQPRPTTSIFSVNQDPGRYWKYLGSLLIVTGTIMLFAVKYMRARFG